MFLKCCILKSFAYQLLSLTLISLIFPEQAHPEQAQVKSAHSIKINVEGAFLNPTWHLRKRISLDKSSDAIRNYISGLYDGNSGDMEQWISTFLQFDGPTAIINIDTRGFDVDEIMITSLETIKTRANVSFIFKGVDGIKKPIPFKKIVLKKVNQALKIGYLFRNKSQIKFDGKITAKFTNTKLGTNWIGEVFVNNVPDKHRTFKPIKNNPPIKQDEWHQKIGKPQFESIKNTLRTSNDYGEKVRLLMGGPKRELPKPQLTYFSHTRNTDIGKLYEYVIRVDNTSSLQLNFIKGFLYLPHKKSENIPLMVINHQTSEYAEEESIGWKGEIENGLCEDFVRKGVACLAPHNFSNSRWKDFFNNYPNWSLLGRSLYSTRVPLDLLLTDRAFKYTGTRIDPKKIGVFGHSFGGVISFFTPFFDPRYSLVGWSNVDVYDNNFARSFSPHISLLEFYLSGDHPMPFVWCDLVKNMLNKQKVEHLIGLSSEIHHASSFSNCLNQAEKNRTVFHGDFHGHLLSFTKRQKFVNFALRKFGINESVEAIGPVFNLEKKEDEDQWRLWDGKAREIVLKAFSESKN